jgi:hypothetical protein
MHENCTKQRSVPRDVVYVLMSVSVDSSILDVDYNISLIELTGKLLHIYKAERQRLCASEPLFKALGLERACISAQGSYLSM